MATVTISKHPGAKKEIHVVPETVVVKAGETLTFVVSDENGFDDGTVVAVTFAERSESGAEEERRGGRGHGRGRGRGRGGGDCGRGPFRHREGHTCNPERGKLTFSTPRRFDCGEVDDVPEGDEPHVWKYDVTWTGLPDLDPRVKIEKGG